MNSKDAKSQLPTCDTTGPGGDFPLISATGHQESEFAKAQAVNSAVMVNRLTDILLDGKAPGWQITPHIANEILIANSVFLSRRAVCILLEEMRLKKKIDFEATPSPRDVYVVT